jgi:orotate phosphoribosyltransferase-like protein
VANQDIILVDDVVTTGATLKEAQEIYDYGMNKVQEQNLLGDAKDINRYKTKIGNNLLIVTGCSLDNMNCRIELFGELDNRDRIFAQDYNSDGTIDDIETGYTTKEIIQELYNKLLNKGQQEGTITHEKEKYKIENIK